MREAPEQPSEGELRALIEGYLHLEGPMLPILHAMQDAFGLEKQWKIYDDVVPTLNALKNASKKIYILANWDRQLQRLV